MSNAKEWLQFWSEVGFEAVRLGRTIYEVVKGDPEKGRAALREITLDYTKRENAEDAIDARIAKAEAEEKEAAAKAITEAKRAGGELPEPTEEGPGESDRPLKAQDIADAEDATRG